jgi:hypothetical protein
LGQDLKTWRYHIKRRPPSQSPLAAGAGLPIESISLTALKWLANTETIGYYSSISVNPTGHFEIPLWVARSAVRDGVNRQTHLLQSSGMVSGVSLPAGWGRSGCWFKQHYDIEHG